MCCALCEKRGGLTIREFLDGVKIAIENEIGWSDPGGNKAETALVKDSLCLSTDFVSQAQNLARL